MKENILIEVCEKVIKKFDWDKFETYDNNYNYFKHRIDIDKERERICIFNSKFENELKKYCNRKIMVNDINTEYYHSGIINLNNCYYHKRFDIFYKLKGLYEYENKKEWKDLNIYLRMTKWQRRYKGSSNWEQFWTKPVIFQKIENSILYGIEYNYGFKQKCSECDENRNVPMTLPSGEIRYSSCPKCGEQRKFFYPIKQELYKSIDGRNYIGENSYYATEDYFDVKFNPEIVNHNKNFKEISEPFQKPYLKSEEILFTTKKECREFCHYMNEINNSLEYKYNRKGGEEIYGRK